MKAKSSDVSDQEQSFVPPFRGYLVAVIGSFLGSLVFGGIGLIIGGLYMRRFRFDPTQVGEPTGLFELAMYVAVGLWLGFVVGCWLALRLPRYPYAGRTAALLAPFLVVGVGLLVNLFYLLLHDSDFAPLFYACLVWVPLVLVLLARFIALRLHSTL